VTTDNDTLPPSKGGPIMACGVCARVLTAWGDDDRVVGWLHVEDFEQPDHVAVPVLQEAVQVEGMCDFCSGLHPTWRYPVADHGFKVKAMDDLGREVPFDGGLLRNNIGDWSACDRCHGYIDRGQWDVLARYVTRCSNRRRGHQPDPEKDDFMAKTLYDYWAMMRDNRIGPPRQIPEWVAAAEAARGMAQ
jgi:hypothetical protein